MPKNYPEHNPTKNNVRIVWIVFGTSLGGDLNQSEKLSEIKLPLENTKANYSFLLRYMRVDTSWQHLNSTFLA